MFPQVNIAHLSYFCVLSFVLMTGTEGAWGTEPYQSEFATPKVSAQLPATIVDHLSPSGVLLYTYSNGLKSPFVEIFWTQKAVIKTTSRSSKKIAYSDLESGSFLGVIHFLPEAGDEYREDFHDQKLKPGYYTMRYAVISDADVHDAVLLSPVGLDRDGARTLSTGELLRLSRRASRSSRPAIMSLVPAETGNHGSPNVRTANDGACVVQANLPVSTSTGRADGLEFSMLVVKPIPDGEGS